MPGQKTDVAAQLASRCISRTLGVQVELNDTGGRQGACDLLLTYERRIIAVEVKLIVDPSHRAADSKSSQLGYTLRSDLAYSWTVHLVREKKWKRALVRIPSLLVELEASGATPSTAHHFWQHDVALLLEFEQLGIDAVFCVPQTEKHPPGYYVMPASWGGGVPEIDQAVSSACELICGRAMTKLRKQLAAADADERHAFLIYGWEYMEALPLSHGVVLPSFAPTLPSGIDGIWLSTTASDSSVIVWTSSAGWVRAAPMG
ncbi:hypothetical protein HY68_18195 [Streptomyces sp. AcH 505]|uniref:hypothetical protein n=1 Tax=Streptomyces sp. AcH 505 TaxID=352211 RepID=UPI000591E63A|nr:hypothetical protein HY68_18195 [Streptomyces sp. AcH 505]